MLDFACYIRLCMALLPFNFQFMLLTRSNAVVPVFSYSVWLCGFYRFKPPSIFLLTVPRRYFCCGSLLLLVLAVRIYTLVQLLC